MLPRDDRDRPMLDEGFTALLTALAVAAPEQLGHIDSSRILLVAGAARRSAHASIRPLSYGGTNPTRVRGKYIKPSITIDGRTMRYEICLRPRFFASLTAAERLRVLAHELWHVSPSFDGTLAADRRHGAVGPHGDEMTIDAIVRSYRDANSPAEDVLNIRGEARMRAWSSRPPSRIPRGAPERDSYDERDLYSAVVLA